MGVVNQGQYSIGFCLGRRNGARRACDERVALTAVTEGAWAKGNGIKRRRVVILAWRLTEHGPAKRRAMLSTSIISSQVAWDAAAGRLATAKELAVDTESNSLYVYRERTCLIQLASVDEAVVLDPLAVGNLERLGEMLADPGMVKVLHGSDYDLRSLDRDYGFQISPLFDTQIGARFLGCARPNLGEVLETYLGVAIPKSRRLQRCDWGRRPLTDEAMEYARNDVEFLVGLGVELRRLLEEAGRLEWVDEECGRLELVRYSAPEPAETAFLGVKGSRGLDSLELGVLKELYLWREDRARRENVPSFRVAVNDELIAASRAAVEIGTGSRRLGAVLGEEAPGLARRLQGGGSEEISAAVERGLRGGPVERPDRTPRGNPWGAETRKRLADLKRVRTQIGTDLGLDPALIWPAVSLERMALAPEGFQEEIDGSADVRAWQRREFGHRWAEALSSGW